MGVVSGIVLSYEFGTNWSRFSTVVGNVIGPLIGYEVLMAFFLEATFLGVLLFGFNNVPPWLYVLSAVDRRRSAPRMSAFWILSANSWMQTPAGYEAARTASPIRPTGRRHLQSELPLSLRAHAQRRLLTTALWCWRWARAFCWPAATSRKAAPCCAWRSG